MDRYICIHGHFYQPPRENPWLEAIELQDSAYPYHDWNERITAECYAPNSVSRILDAENRIIRLVNNYAKISFNFGPTLLGWLAANAPEVYHAILAADRQSQENFSGHGSAIAQPYSHIILPLANHRDRYTQILWGISDFEHHFGRRPEGMWLPETAVDLESLEILAELGIRFTILAPHQANRVRSVSSRNWLSVTGGAIDPTRVYEQRLPSGRSLAIFFYDGPISRAVAFEGLLSRGESFANRLSGAFSDERDWPQLVHIATDGESYGHHHRFGDMALAYALNYIEANGLARLTNYGEFLEKHPPTHQVEISEKTSWSCSHGIDRWWSDCGCNSGSHPDWNQAWRTPLRDTFDWLRDSIAAPYEKKAAGLLKDPWAARNEYINVIHDCSAASLKRFFARHGTHELTDTDRTVALKLLELQRHAQLMYTSCGWFFDDLSGIETIQVLQLAGRAVQLAQQLFGDSLESRFVEKLARVRSNVAECGDGQRVYEKFVRASRVDWERVGAHYAISSLFESYPDRTRIYCFAAERKDYQVYAAGLTRLVVGRVRLTSEVTAATSELAFGVLHMGDHNVNGGVEEFTSEDSYRAFTQEAVEAFRHADFAEVIRIMDRRFGESSYSLRSLFRDQQRKALDIILGSSLKEAEILYRQIYEHRAPMMRFLTDLNIPLPPAFHAAAEFVLNRNLREILERDDVDTERVLSSLEAAKFEGVRLDSATLEFAYRQNLQRLIERFVADPSEACLKRLSHAVSLLDDLPFSVDLWKVQNGYYQVLQSVYPKMVERRKRGDEPAQAWVDSFKKLGHKLAVKVI
jgi:alpha-amylase/alpha-mannosidase (GH57 family)